MQITFPHMTNILRGIVPTAAIWGTAPTSLGNCTDGDITTVTGTGSKVLGAAGYVGELVFDLGAIKTVIMGARVGLWSTAGGFQVFMYGSLNNITWDSSGASSTAVTSVTESIFNPPPRVLYARYLDLLFYINAAATANVNIYDVSAWELAL